MIDLEGLVRFGQGRKVETGVTDGGKTVADGVAWGWV